MSYLDEAQVEIVTVDYFRELGYDHIHGPVIAPDGEAPEQTDYERVVLPHWLRNATAQPLGRWSHTPHRGQSRGQRVTPKLDDVEVDLVVEA